MFSEAFIMGIERKLLYNSFRRMAHIAVKRKATALPFTTLLIDVFQSSSRSENSMPPIERITRLSFLLLEVVDNDRGNFTDFVVSALH